MPIYYQARISAVAGSSITIYSEKLNSGDTLYLNFLEIYYLFPQANSWKLFILAFFSRLN